ncbi:MAG: putative endoIII-related endonuclease [Halonotius sp. J07HN4]|nr:MAG: putative endoIII-related endonuclease [Halonotius sp. J07HN4]
MVDRYPITIVVLTIAMEIRNLHRDLIELHGRPNKTYSEDGVRQLLTTILSQNVADVQTARASKQLYAAYPDYRAMETADHDELAEVISDVGLMNQKATRIQRSLTAIREETGGEYTLAFLGEMDTDKAQAWLTDIKGVGPKTASVVLNFHFEKPTFAVDTHIERLATRFGLIDESTTAEQAHEVLNEVIPDDIKYSLHVLLISHGKEYCSAQTPDCDNPVCDTYCACEHC